MIKYILEKQQILNEECSNILITWEAKLQKKIKPIEGKIICICNGYFSTKQEQHYTQTHIEKYGYCNVRGGSFTNSKTFRKKVEKPTY